jgi:hypothetical protein
VKNKTQKNSIKNKGNEELIIKGIPDTQKAVKLVQIIRSLEASNMSLNFFNN